MMCQEVAAALAANPELRVIVTGPHVMRNIGQYRNLLEEFGADLDRVVFTSPTEIDRRVVGTRAQLFVDDFGDMGAKERDAVARAEQYLS